MYVIYIFPLAFHKMFDFNTQNIFILVVCFLSKTPNGFKNIMFVETDSIMFSRVTH